MANLENKQLKKLGPSKIPRAISPMAKPANTLKRSSCDEDIPKSKQFLRNQFMSLRLPSPRTPSVTKTSQKSQTTTPSSPQITSSTASSFKQKVLRFCHLVKPTPPPKPKLPKMVKTPSKESRKVEKFEKELESIVRYTERSKKALEIQNELIKKYMWQISELKEIVQYLNAEVYVLKTQQEEFEKKGLNVSAESVNKLCEFLKHLNESSKVYEIEGLDDDSTVNTWGYYQGCEENVSLYESVLL